MRHEYSLDALNFFLADVRQTDRRLLILSGMALLSIVSVLTIRADAIDYDRARGLHDGPSTSHEKPSGLSVLMSNRDLHRQSAKHDHRRLVASGLRGFRRQARAGGGSCPRADGGIHPSILP
jgi:hypothetical protein